MAKNGTFKDKDGNPLYPRTLATLVAGLSTVATSGSYSDLSNKPTIGSATITIQKNSTTVDSFSVNATSNKTINITVPTTLDDISDGSTRKLSNYLPLNGGTMNLGEGLKIHADNNYFGTNADARIISLLDGNDTTCDGGLIIDERCTLNGTEYITELLRIRHNEFKWKGTNISLSNHTHTTSLATDTGTSTITLAHGGKYKLTAGGTSVIFTMPSDNNTTYSAGTGLTLSNNQFSVSQANASAILNLLSEGTSDPVDNDYFISQYVNGGTSTTTYHRRPVSKLYNYMKGKFDSVYQAKGSYSASNHTHTASLAADTGTSAITLSYGGKYKLTAGGSSVIFTMPSADDTNTWRPVSGNGTSIGSNSLNIKPGSNVSVSVSNGDITISATDTNTHNTHKVNSGYKSDGSTAITSSSASSGDITLGDSGATAGSYGDSSNQTPAYGATFKVPYITVNAKGIVTGVSEHTVKIPASDNSNSWRKVQLNGTDKLGTGTGTNPLNLKAGTNVTITESSGTFTFAATDTTYESKTAASGGTAVSLVTTGEKYTWNNKQNALTSQTAYSAKGSATKVPQITTNSLGQVTAITEITITQPTASSLSAVQYASQSLTDAQKSQARSNIGAGTSNLSIGTSATTAAAGNHTHSTSFEVAAAAIPSQLTLQHNTKYILNAGGTAYVFTMPLSYRHHISLYFGGQISFEIINQSGTPFTAYSDIIAYFTGVNIMWSSEDEYGDFAVASGFYNGDPLCGVARDTDNTNRLVAIHSEGYCIPINGSYQYFRIVDRVKPL